MADKNKIKDYIKSLNKPKILIIRNGLIGDTVFITPLLTKFKKHFPTAVLDFAIAEIAKPILLNFDNVGEVFGFKRFTPLLQQVAFYWKLRKKKYDLILVQEVNPHYTMMAKLAGPKYIVSFHNQYRFLQNFSVQRKGHAVEAEQRTFNELFDDLENYPTVVKLTDEEVENGKRILNQYGISDNDLVICIHPACSEVNSVRDWIKERFAELANRLIKNQDAKIIFTGINKDKPTIDEIRSLINYKTYDLSLNLREAASVYKHCKLIIGLDTGTLHLANAVGTPSLMITGFSDPKDTGPYDLTFRSKAVHVELDCLPCVHIEPKPERWDICKNKRPAICMEMLTVDKVYNEALTIINNRIEV